MKSGYLCLKRLNIADAIDAREVVRNRHCAERLDSSLIHTGGVKRSDNMFVRTLRGIRLRSAFKNLAQDFKVLFLQNLKCSPTRVRSGHWIILDPISVHELVEVVARFARGVHALHIKPAGILKREKPERKRDFE